MKFKPLKIFGKKQRQSIEKHTLYFELTDACASKNCPVCFLIEKKERQYIESIFYEYVNDPAMRTNLRQSQGLCAAHVNLFLALGDALGLAILADDLVRHFIEADRSSFKPSTCPLCQSKAHTETRVVHACAEYLAVADFWQALENGVGLCLRHWRLIDGSASTDELKSRLLIFEQRKLAQHQALLTAFIEKNNFTTPHEAVTDAEAESYRLLWRLLRV
jgi:hypothetical protein